MAEFVGFREESHRIGRAGFINVESQIIVDVLFMKSLSKSNGAVA